MKKIFAILVIFTAFACALSAKDDNVKTAVFTVNPPMSCQNCENKIKSNLRFEKGVKEIVTSLPAQTVTVTYNSSKTDVEKIQKGFSKIGYTASIADGNKAATTCTKGADCTKACEKACDKAGKSCCKKGEKTCCKENAGKKCDKKCDEKCDKK